MQKLLFTVAITLICVFISVNCQQEAPQVHVIFMNHLDVGYNGIPEVGFINNVVNMYFQIYFPRALDLVDNLTSQGYKNYFRYTTHPWLLDLYFNCPKNLMLNNVKLYCPSSQEILRMKSALSNGDILYHAGPMNMQLENMDSVLLEASLNISRRLDQMYHPNKSLRVLSQRDVPGISSSIVDTLYNQNVKAVSVGVNPASYPPEVTREPFLWQTPSGKSIIGIWHPGGYPNNPGDDPWHPGGLSVKDCSMLPTVPHILCFAFRTDNSGPPVNVSEVLLVYSILSYEFPGAEIRASSLEKFVEAVYPYTDRMQVVQTELSDTWIQGIASDPKKMAQYRAVSRVLSTAWKQNRISGDDKVWQDAIRYLVKLPEHTWGLPSVGDNVNYTNIAFQGARNGKNFKNCEAAWTEQRAFINITINSLSSSRPDLVKQIDNELRLISPNLPDLSKYSLTNFDPSKTHTFGDLSVRFSFNGGFDYFKVNGVNFSYATPYSPMATFSYVSYNELDDNKLLLSYGNPGYGKPNVTKNANPMSKTWPYTVSKFYTQGNSTFLFQLLPSDLTAVDYYGAPQQVYVSYNFDVANRNVSIEVLLWNKTSTRLEEGIYFNFMNNIDEGANCRWFMKKVDDFVDPLYVAYGASVRQHAVNDFVSLSCPISSKSRYNAMHNMFIYSPDVPLVCPFNRYQPPTPFPYLDRLLFVDGMSYNLYNNVWNTNYIFWYPYTAGDEHFKSRFYINY